MTVHVLLYKRNVGASVSWIGIAWLSPFLGGLLYVTLGINRVKRRARRLRRERGRAIATATRPTPATQRPIRCTPLEYAIGRLTGLPCEPGNRSKCCATAIEAYPTMLAAIAAAEKSIGLVSYIFRADKAGEAFIEALIRAQRRGVEVRVLIDGVGGGYFWSGIYRRLSRAGVPVARFLHSYLPWRTPFLNLRNHRKLLVVDGRIAFTGGLNIGAENICADSPPHPCATRTSGSRARSSRSSTEAFADDWLFTTGERLLDRELVSAAREGGRGRWRASSPPAPTRTCEQIEFVALHAISCAAEVGPRGDALLPAARPADDGARASRRCAACRSTSCCPSIPTTPLLDWARRVPLRPLIEAGCRVWLTPPPFDHSKLMVIDDAWSLVGSANWDTRSFRLNFELNVELHDRRLRVAADHARAAPHAGRARPDPLRPAAQQRGATAAALSLAPLFLPRHTGEGRVGERHRWMNLDNFRSEMGGRLC